MTLTRQPVPGALWALWMVSGSPECRGGHMWILVTWKAMEWRQDLGFEGMSRSVREGWVGWRVGTKVWGTECGKTQKCIQVVFICGLEPFSFHIPYSQLKPWISFEGSHNSVLMGDTSPYSWVYVTQAWPSRHQFPLWWQWWAQGRSMRPSSACRAKGHLSHTCIVPPLWTRGDEIAAATLPSWKQNFREGNQRRQLTQWRQSDARKESESWQCELSPERAGSEGESIPGLSVMQTDVFSCLYVTIWVGPLVSCKQKSKIRLGIFGYSRGIFLAFLIFITII